MSKKIVQLFVTIYSVLLFQSGCSDIGEAVGIDIPKDNLFDETVVYPIYDPFVELMCEWNFRESGCPVEVVKPTDTNDTNTTTSTTSTTTTTGGTGTTTTTTTTSGTTGDTTDEKVKDIVSRWYDILNETQRTDLVDTDKNRFNPDDEQASILTLLSEIPDNQLKVRKDSRVVIPFYAYHKTKEKLLASTESTDITKISSEITGFGSTGLFKLVEANSVLTVQIDAVGEIGDEASISVKIQDEDSDKYDEEPLLSVVVDENSTYNEVQLFFTYKTIILEEEDSRNIFFGISYTEDTDVTVVTEREIGDLTKLDFSTTTDDTDILDINISNDNGVPYFFSLTATGTAGESEKLAIVAKDSFGNYDWVLFDVLIVEKGKGDYVDNTTTSTSTSSTTSSSSSGDNGLIGNDYDALSDKQRQMITDDTNNIAPPDKTRPIITILNDQLETPPYEINILKDSELNIPFFVSDTDSDIVGTFILSSDKEKVKATINGGLQFESTYANKLFGMRLEALGEVGDSVEVLIHSEEEGVYNYYDEQKFVVNIVGDEDLVTYIPPEIYLGFSKIQIEEGGFRDGIMFNIESSKPLLELTEDNFDIADKKVAEFLQWYSQNPPKFGVKAVGTAGDDTVATITASDGTDTASSSVIIEIVAKGSLSTTTTTSTSSGDPATTTSTSSGDPATTTSTSSGDPVTSTTSSGDPATSTTSSGDPATSTTSSGDPVTSTTSSGDPVTSTTSSGDPVTSTTSSGEPPVPPTSTSTTTSSTTSGGSTEDESMQYCNAKIDEGWDIIDAFEVTAEGFSNSNQTMILHTNKTAVINGATQNVTIKLIYQDLGVANNDEYLDSTYTLPKFRIDYNPAYANQVYYIIDEGAGICYMSTFPNADSLPFGLLDKAFQ